MMMACLLGLEDESISKEDVLSLSYQVNKVGGRPVIYNRFFFATTYFLIKTSHLYQNWASGIHSNPECKACGRKMLLTVQVYAPLDDSPNHRTLFVFCCLQPKCQTSSEGWLCFRDEVPDTSQPNPVKPQTVSTASKTTWLDDADDWGDEEMDGDNGNSTNNNDKSESTVSELKMECLSLENQNLNVDEVVAATNSGNDLQQNEENIASAEVESVEESVMLDDFPTQPSVDLRALLSPSAVAIPDELCTSEFSSFYLNVIEEQLTESSDTKLDRRARELWEEYQRKENCDLKKIQKPKQTSTAGADETYEKPLPSHGDRLVHKFIKQVQYCPTQLIRYGRGESPLLFKPLSKDVADKKCQHCSAPLVFELQLMPHLSQRLMMEDASHQSVELGTVLVLTCSRSCWTGTLREEYLIVQSEMY